LSSSVTLADQLQEVVLIGSSPRQKSLQQVDDIAAAQQRCRFLLTNALFEEEQHGDHHHGHVVMPGRPPAHLIVGHAAFAFSILKGTLNPKTGPLHDSETLVRRAFWGIAEAVFDGLWRAHFSADDEMPALGSGLGPVPEPDPLVQAFHQELAAGAVAQGHGFPGLVGLLLGPLVNADGLGIGPKARWRSTALGRSRGQMRLRIGKIDPLVFMDIGDEGFPGRVKGAQQPGFLAITGIHADPLETNAEGTGMVDHVQGMLGLGAHHDVRVGDTGLLAPLGIINPILGQIEPRVDQGMAGLPAKNRADRDLAVVDFAEPAAPLAGDAHRSRPFLDATRIVEEQARVIVAAEERVRLHGHLVDDIAVRPR